jgi:ASC-1-like (ASCH) protein
MRGAVVTVHDLKCDYEAFDDIQAGVKKCEVRKDDRGFAVGDTLRLHRQLDGQPTGETLRVFVTHIQRGYGLPVDICVMSIIRTLTF